MEAAWCVVLLVIALSARPYMPFTGALFSTVIALYAIGRMALEPTRESADPARTIRFNVIVSSALLAVAAATLILRR